MLVSLQRTPHDANCQLRIFAPLDDVLTMLAAELGLDAAAAASAPRAVPADSPHRAPAAADADDDERDVFYVPYDERGERVSGGARRALDLRPGARLVVGFGPNAGDLARVVGRNAEGHWRVAIEHARRAGEPAVKALWTEVRLLGSWWADAAVNGEVERLPVFTPPP